MADDKDEPVLRLVQKQVLIKSIEEKRSDDYAKRSTGQKDFYAKARISTVAIEVLIEALKSSVILDKDGEVIVEWNEALISELLDDIEDPGPRKRY